MPLGRTLNLLASLLAEKTHILKQFELISNFQVNSAYYLPNVHVEIRLD
jgi:hypothetical protein